MKISVITPFYEGNEYMSDYVKCMEANRVALEAAGHELEVILVNDSPWKTLEAPPTEGQIIKVLTNSKNQGIHYSRVFGLNQAVGDYVMFLDQDDLIAEDALCVLTQFIQSKQADIVISNAKLEQKDGSVLTWYRTSAHFDLAWDLPAYLKVGIQIISPGQCLIKKSAIPDFWKEHLVRVNGADDYYLWLLMMVSNAKACVYLDAEYIHKYTGSNLSKDTAATDASVYDFLDLLNDCDYFKREYVYTLHEMITYKAQFREGNLLGKITCSLANLNLFIANVRYKRRTKTGYGFNR